MVKKRVNYKGWK